MYCIHNSIKIIRHAWLKSFCIPVPSFLIVNVFSNINNANDWGTKLFTSKSKKVTCAFLSPHHTFSMQQMHISDLLPTNCTTNSTCPHTGDYCNMLQLLLTAIFSKYWYNRIHVDKSLVNAVMNLLVPQKAGNLLTSWRPVSFSKRTLLHGVSKYVTCVCW